MNENGKKSGNRWVGLNILCAAGVAALVVVLIFFTPLRTLQPGYLTPQTRAQIVDFALRVDSLDEAVARQNLYVTNLQDILSGRVRLDTVKSIDTLTALRAADLMEQTEREKEFARLYEATEKYNLTTQATTVAAVTGLNLIVPVRGVVVNGFAPQGGSFGVDMSPTVRTNISSVLDGTVVFSGYVAATGNTIVVQHGGDLVSVYANCGTVVCHVGDRVRAGEALAAAASVGGADEGRLVHFELWHKGVALDPSLYIAF